LRRRKGAAELSSFNHGLRFVILSGLALMRIDIADADIDVMFNTNGEPCT
jgi:hypothetical protein